MQCLFSSLPPRRSPLTISTTTPSIRNSPLCTKGEPTLYTVPTVGSTSSTAFSPAATTLGRASFRSASTPDGTRPHNQIDRQGQTQIVERLFRYPCPVSAALPYNRIDNYDGAGCPGLTRRPEPIEAKISSYFTCEEVQTAHCSMVALSSLTASTSVASVCLGGKLLSLPGERAGRGGGRRARVDRTNAC